MSCPSAGNCSAVGTYVDASDDVQGLLLTETAGRWAPGVEAALPANAAPTGENQDGLAIISVSCASPGNCSAVGSYPVAGSAVVQGLLLNEVAGRWAPGIEAVPPPDANEGVGLSSVSCPSAGNCTAVGGYGGDVGGSEGILLTETEGTWQTGVEARLPANAAAVLGLSAVSCASVANCTAVGTYVDSSDHYEGLLLGERGGVWTAGVEATLPTNAVSQGMVTLSSVSCASAGNCTAVGRYNQGLGKDGFGAGGGLLLTETAGTWGTGVEAPVWASAAPPDNVSVNAVSCASAGNCTAVGSSDGHGVLLTEIAGVWSNAVKAVVPANASAKRPGVSLSSVSCASAGNCTAVGAYSTAHDGSRGLVMIERGGTWETRVEAALPANAHGAALASVSCPTAQSCSAVGTYGGAGSSAQGLLLTSSATPPKPCLVPKLKGKALSAAKRSITSHNCTVGKIKHATSRTVESGHVISQTPAPGRRLSHGTKVSLVLSTGRR